MAILAAYIVPHPPLIVPEIGQGAQKDVQSTSDALDYVARRVMEHAPDTVVFITPHSVCYSDYIHISPELIAEGDFSHFGAPDIKFGVMYEKKLAGDITRICEERGLSAGTFGGEDNDALDHGVMVPLYFMNKYFQDYRCLRVSISSSLPLDAHYGLGQVIAEVCDSFYRNTVVIASGDLSHKLSEDGPYGFSQDGAVFDRKILDVIKSGDPEGFLRFTQEECESAAECGLRSFAIMAGMLDKTAVSSTLLSYEAPLGVGYAVGEFLVLGDNDAEMPSEPETECARLAKSSLEAFVATCKLIKPPENTSVELLSRRAGVFVSLKADGELRGCIGTISPVCENIASEIIRNAVSAGTYDPRFEKVTADELPFLEYSVDVLGAPEHISDISELDVRKYGVIVTKGDKRGLLLPNLDGVDTISDQLAIALYKAGISPDESYELERFEVVRYI